MGFDIMNTNCGLKGRDWVTDDFVEFCTALHVARIEIRCKLSSSNSGYELRLARPTEPSEATGSEGDEIDELNLGA